MTRRHTLSPEVCETISDGVFDDSVTFKITYQEWINTREVSPRSPSVFRKTTTTTDEKPKSYRSPFRVHGVGPCVQGRA